MAVIVPGLAVVVATLRVQSSTVSKRNGTRYESGHANNKRQNTTGEH